jgi:hypothetical protein
MAKKKDEPITIDMTPEPSPEPEGLQKIMVKYTKLVMKQLYGVDVYVFFCDISKFRAIYRPKELAPAGTDAPSPAGFGMGYSYKHAKIWRKKPQCSITFHSRLYKPNLLAPHAWKTIVHEVTHYEEERMKLGDNWQLSHTDKFEKALKRNIKKVDDLRKQFNKEFGIDEDFIYEEEEDLL